MLFCILIYTKYQRLSCVVQYTRDLKIYCMEIYFIIKCYSIILQYNGFAWHTQKVSDIGPHIIYMSKCHDDIHSPLVCIIYIHKTHVRESYVKVIYKIQNNNKTKNKKKLFFSPLRKAHILKCVKTYQLKKNPCRVGIIMI